MPKRAVTKKTAGAPERSFEESLGRLEEIVSRLERGDAPLDSALKLYEEGVRLSRACAAQLKDAERRVEILEDKNGELRGRPFGDAAAREDGGAEDDEAEADDEEEDDDDDTDETDEIDGEAEAGAPDRGRRSPDTLF